MQKHILTIIFLFTGVFIQAQDTAKSVPKWKYYVDYGFGAIPEDVGFFGTASISVGVTNNARYSLGLASSSISNSYKGSGSGLGLELRLTPIRWLLLKGQVGRIIRASAIDDSGPIVYTYLPKESSPFFWRGTIAIRFAQILFAGISVMQTNDIIFAYKNSPSPISTGQYKTQFSITMWQLGMSLPVLPKKKKENQ